MKKIKLLLMLLLTLFLFKSTSLTTYAATIDIGEIPEYPMTLNEYPSMTKYLPGKSGFTNEDNGKLIKFTVPEYSYVIFYAPINFSLDGDSYFYLYEDENEKNKITENGVSIEAFLPKGDYYIKIDPINLQSWDSNDLYYGRVSLNNLMKANVTKKKNYYLYDLEGYDQGYKVTAAMVDGFSKFYYGTEYSFNLYLDDMYRFSKEYYGNVYYKVSIKNKNSSISVKPTRDTKTILDIEASGGNAEEDFDKVDRTKPTVKGVKNGKTYKKTVTIKVSDKSGIKKVTLNGKKMSVSKFKKGYKIKRKSTTKSYTLKVWDKAGNKKVVKFKIKKKA